MKPYLYMKNEAVRTIYHLPTLAGKLQWFVVFSCNLRKSSAGVFGHYGSNDSRDLYFKKETFSLSESQNPKCNFFYINSTTGKLLLSCSAH